MTIHVYSCFFLVHFVFSYIPFFSIEVLRVSQSQDAVVCDNFSKGH